MATIYIDNRPYEVKDGQNLLQTCLTLGFDIPYFCWHPAIHSVGACRACAVKQFRDEKDTRGKIVMSCMTPASDGTRISIDDPEARYFRAAVIEWLMTNHPHDCPVCDEGGECHLQDMTVMTGHTVRRFRFKKRTHRNQDLGPFINHEMNRCIQCYRCVRFYRDYAGGRDLDVFGCHNHVYFGRHEDGVLENEFSGNLVEICPTGVFTDRTLKKHYTRKWDLQTAPSICIHCSLGCNTIPGERYGSLRRILNRYNHEVNGYFLCDRGRFGYEFVNSSRRMRHILARESRSGRPLASAGIDEALHRVASLLHFGADVVGIGSPRASLEANFLLRLLVGPERFYAGIPDTEAELVSAIITILREGPARTPSLREVRESDAVLILGEDPTETAPLLSLSVRQAIRREPIDKAKIFGIPEWFDSALRTATENKNGPLFIASPAYTKLDDKATLAWRGTPDDIARLGFAIAHELFEDAPAVPHLTEEMRSAARTIAASLRGAKQPLVLSGTGCGSIGVIRAAANVARALSAGGVKAGLCYTVPECNSLGLGHLSGRGLDSLFREIGNNRDRVPETVIVLENNLYRRTTSGAFDALLDKARHVVVIDHTMHATAARADILLPSATFAESSGTLISNEGRCQRFFQVFPPGGEIRQSWQWLLDMLHAAGQRDSMQWEHPDDINRAIAETVPGLQRVIEAAPGASFRIAGRKIPRQPHRYSGRTSMHADKDIREQRPPADPDSAMAFSMEGYEGRPPSALIPRYWIPGWNSVQAVSRYQKEVGGQLHGGDPGVRLIEPNDQANTVFLGDPPEAFEPREDELLVTGLYHIFGSEELSSLSPAVAQRMPGPYIGLNREDASRLGISDKEEIDLSICGTTIRLAAGLRDDLPPGIAGVPTGIKPVIGLVLPAWGKIQKTGETK